MSFLITVSSVIQESPSIITRKNEGKTNLPAEVMLIKHTFHQRL